MITAKQTTGHTTRFPSALHAIHKVIEGALASGRHPRGETWRARTVAEHVEHARVHLEKLVCGDTTEPHLEHAACRTLMALEVAIENAKKQHGVPTTETDCCIDKSHR